MDWDAAYSNTDAVATSQTYPDKYAAVAAAFRENFEGVIEIDVSYGDAERECLDIFRPKGESRGLAIFVHGGYWRRFDKSYFSHMAAGAIAHGWTVAVPSYTLCPAIRVSGITRQVAAAVTLAAEMVDGPIRLAGHSAGGHLATRMICDDGTLPRSVTGRFAHVMSISGLHDLRPLLNVDVNETLGLDADEVATESPALLKPLTAAPLTAWVGAVELSEFVRQTALIANIWRGMGVETTCVEDTHRHHFNVIEPLQLPDSPITECWLGL